MEFNTEDIGWPYDTVIFAYTNIPGLLMVVKLLLESGNVFVISPNHSAIAMSADAAREIGLK